MIIKQTTKTTNILYIDEPLSYEYDSNSSSIVLLDNFKYEIFYDKYKLPICIAKTQYSITDNPKILGNPINNKMTITDIKISNGAGFIVIYMGNILTLPGLGKNSNYLKF